MDRQWDTYHQATSAKSPRDLLLQALAYAKLSGEALDLGAGALNEVRYLLDKGFHVTAIDNAPSVERLADSLHLSGLQFEASSFDMFEFKPDTYDLICALYALPFNSPESFDSVVGKIVGSLKSRGVFCAQFFGIRDGWHAQKDMTFSTEADIRRLLETLEILVLSENEFDGATTTGEQKHWHIFEVIARRVN